MAEEVPGLLARLKILSPNHVYFLAPKATVLRGYEYYSQGRLEAYYWDQAKTVLTAVVRGGSRYAVRISEEQDGLRYSCTCSSWSSGFQCHHVVCALLTTVNLLVPDRFRMAGREIVNRKPLEQQLLSGSGVSLPSTAAPKGVPLFEVILLHKDGYSDVRISNHGIPCQSIAGMPTELALLFRSLQDQAWSSQTGLRDFLNHHGSRFPLFLETDSDRVPLAWNPSATYTTKTELNLTGSTVTIAARCVRFGEVLERVCVVMGFVVDLNSRRLSPLDYEGGWAVYDLLYANAKREGLLSGREILVGPLSLSEWTASVDVEGNGGETGMGLPETRPSFAIPFRQFLRLQFDCPLQDKARIFATVQLKIDGKDMPVPDLIAETDGSLYQYRVTLKAERKELSSAPLLDQDVTIVRTECWFGESQTSPCAALFQVFPYINHSPAVSGGVRTRKRRTLLYDTLFQVWGLKKGSEAKKLIKSCLSREEFRVFKLKAEAEALFRRFSDPAFPPSARLGIRDGQWCLVPNHWEREALLYALPYNMFGADLFEHMERHDEMALPASTLYPRLPELFAKLQEAGIELFFQDAPITTSKWEYSVDARRSSSIDWFELHPEILCDGVKVDAKALEQILQQGGMIEADGSLRVIDRQTQQILRALASLTKKSDHKIGAWEKRAVVHVPKLQILDWVDLRRRGVKVLLPPADEALIDRLLHFERIEPLPLPRYLNATLRHYQEEGYRWLAFLYQHRLGACLADDMGLGKTLQAISLLAGLKEGIIQPPEPVEGPHLVVLPPSLLFNWEEEIKRFYPSLRVRSYTGKERTTAFEEVDVILTTYGLIRRDILLLEPVRFNVIVFDEAQAVKNIMARTTGATRRLNGYFKLVMTGTPLENHVGEYYSLMDLCVPGLLGDYEEMRARLKAPSPLVLETIMQRTRPFVLRRTKSQILKELPPKIETDLYLELTDRQKLLYQKTVTEIRSTISTAFQTQTAAQARVIALTAILKLRQICLSSRLLDPSQTEPSPKVTFLLERLHELIEEGHSALVFSQFTSFLDVVEEAFRAHDIAHVRLDGSTPTPMRKKLVRQFQEGQTPSVFLLSLKAGGQGLNLTKASYVFHLDPWWNPAVENQASDRAHRIGQHQTVSIMRLLMRHTIEEKMMELKRQKLELYHAVLEGAAHHGGGASLSQKDFEFLLE